LTRDDQRLDPFRLAEYAGLLVVSFAEIEALLSKETLAELLDGGSKNGRVVLHRNVFRMGRS
jgi:hypothetical protein